MENPCDHLVPFAEGELKKTAAQRFRDHLKDCTPCQEHLVEVLQLSARLRAYFKPCPL